MIILGMFYVCSAVVSIILRGVAGILRAVGVTGKHPCRVRFQILGECGHCDTVPCLMLLTHTAFTHAVTEGGVNQAR